MRWLLEPWTEFFRFIPAVAMITVAVIWFGIGEESKVFLIAYTTVFVVIISTAAGVGAVGRDKIRAIPMYPAAIKALKDYIDFIRPEMIDYRHLPVEIALAEGPTRGMTVCDQRTLTGRRLSVIRNSSAPNCHVALDVRGPALVGHIVEAMHGFG